MEQWPAELVVRAVVINVAPATIGPDLLVPPMPAPVPFRPMPPPLTRKKVPFLFPPILPGPIRLPIQPLNVNTDATLDTIGPDLPACCLRPTAPATPPTLPMRPDIPIRPTFQPTAARREPLQLSPPAGTIGPGLAPV